MGDLRSVFIEQACGGNVTGTPKPVTFQLLMRRRRQEYVACWAFGGLHPGQGLAQGQEVKFGNPPPQKPWASR